MHYVGVLKEIIDVSHGALCLVVMKCSQIPLNTHGNATVKQDEYIMVIRAKNPIHSVLFFILVFFNTSGLLVLLGLDLHLGQW
jgi:hypothetical protein